MFWEKFSLEVFEPEGAQNEVFEFCKLSLRGNFLIFYMKLQQYKGLKFY